jgi:hypothetical protein
LAPDDWTIISNEEYAFKANYNKNEYFKLISQNSDLDLKILEKCVNYENKKIFW